MDNIIKPQNITLSPWTAHPKSQCYKCVSFWYQFISCFSLVLQTHYYNLSVLFDTLGFDEFLDSFVHSALVSGNNVNALGEKPAHGTCWKAWNVVKLVFASTASSSKLASKSANTADDPCEYITYIYAYIYICQLRFTADSLEQITAHNCVSLQLLHYPCNTHD